MSAEVGREACPCCPVPSRLCARASRCLRLVWSVLSCGGSVLCVSVSHARALSGPPLFLLTYHRLTHAYS